ncbi:MAG TPA: hypothetical protein VMT16_01155, partial [Thermoanaerobaculia bacterium]|nr:hypothetical protein [Thermoanaerobaculia bacterium]
MTAKTNTSLALALAFALTAAAAADTDSQSGDPPASESAIISQLETLPLESLERGQRGWGFSVFSGRQPERFEVEVLGVMRNPSPDVSYVLARLSGMGLEESGVVAG